MSTRVAALQMVSTPSVPENLALARSLIAQAAADGAVLALLPEWFGIVGRRDTDKLAVRERDGEGPMQAMLSEAAREHRIWVIGGSVPLDCGEQTRVRNSCVAYGPDGGRVARYDKIHLFRFERGEERYDESRTLEPGSTPVTFETPFGRVGLSICYDLRFPELYRALCPSALVVVPAAFTYTTGRSHWEVLLRARAIENQCYVLAAAQGGRHRTGRRTFGHSMLVDPWGEVVACLPEGAGVVSGVLEDSRLAAVRESLPALTHRRI